MRMRRKSCLMCSHILAVAVVEDLRLLVRLLLKGWDVVRRNLSPVVVAGNRLFEYEPVLPLYLAGGIGE
jgi:hypothetical protein